MTVKDATAEALLDRIRYLWRHRERVWEDTNDTGRWLLNRAVSAAIKDCHELGLWDESAAIVRELWDKDVR